MDLRKTYITRLLSAIALLLASALLAACFDIPSEPSTKNSLKGVTIQIEQNGIVDTVLLKIHPTDTAILSAQIHPSKFKNNLNFSWYYVSGDQTKNWVGLSSKITIPPKTSKEDIPNLLQVTDKEGNSSTFEFEVIINSPPTLKAATTPAQGDTLYGDTATSFFFNWQSYDNDNEKLSHTVIIDSSHYEIGELTHFYQSGFAEGKHTFQVFVYDKYGDADSSSVIPFYVINKEKD